jgi:hypothetical protein
MGGKAMGINIDSWRFRTLAQLIEDRSFNDGICIDLNVLRFIRENNMYQVEDLTGDIYVTLRDMQDVANTFCCNLDIINY